MNSVADLKNDLGTYIWKKILFYKSWGFLGMKANVSEAEHPLLCESTRKQKGELAIAMLVHYKDDQVKLSKVGNISYY